MERIPIRRSTSLYPVLAVTLALLFVADHAAPHTAYNGAPPAAGSVEATRTAVSIGERLGELHSAVVHFPIAMLLSAVLSEALLVATGRTSFRHITRFAIWIGALGAVSAASVGWLAASALEDAPEGLLAWHRWLGVSTTLWSLATLWVSEHATDARSLLRWLIACSALLAAATGYLGGELVHDAQAWSNGVR